MQQQAAADVRTPASVPADWPVYSNAPSQAYQSMIGGGLTETHGLDHAQVQTYVAGATGFTHSPVAKDPTPAVA